MFFRTAARQFSKRMTLPRLSPTHTKARILKWEVSEGDAVSSYDAVLVVECSSDFITEAFRESPDEKVRMLIDTQDEGTIKNLRRVQEDDEWIEVGTELGIIDDGDPVDGDWTWQAYLDQPKSDE